MLETTTLDLKHEYDGCKRSAYENFQHEDDFHVALLHLAIKENDILAIKDLVRVQNWIHTTDKTGRNALHWVIAFGSKDACELLLSHTREEGVHHADKNGRTPLHFAAIWGRSDVAKMILARYANVNALDRKGMTALHYAAQNSNPFLIRSLIKRGADKQAKDIKRRIPFQIAVHWGSLDEILDLLDPNFSSNRAQKTFQMPQARRFAESLSPKGLQEAIHAISNLNKDHPAELITYEMQKESDKMRKMLCKVVVRKLKKWEQPITLSKDYALKALATHRKKMLVEHQMKKIEDTNRMQHVKKDTSSMWCACHLMRRPRRAYGWASLQANTEASSLKAGIISQSGSKTPTRTKSSQSNSPIAIKKPNRMHPPTFSRPNSPNIPMKFHKAKTIKPNPTARDGWPSPLGSIREDKDGQQIKVSPSKGKKYMKEIKHMKPMRQPIRTPSSSRLALSEFVGTSARHNALGLYHSPVVHKCIDAQKLMNQWL